VRAELAGVSCGAHFFSVQVAAVTLSASDRQKAGKEGRRAMETHWIVIVLGQLVALLTG
jgi:uncharacterized membrane protein YsdA (DUF1294 family)